MSFVEIVLLALALSADAFSVAAAVGIGLADGRQRLTLSASFGLFQALLAALGAFLGRFLHEVISAYDHWAAFALLEVIGVRMIFQARRQRRQDQGYTGPDPTRGFTLVALSVAVSIDAFGAGVGMAMTQSGSKLSLACLIIGAVAFAATWVGTLTGKVVRRRLGASVEALAGVVLMLLGARMILI